MSRFAVTAFYKFFPLPGETLNELQSLLQREGEKLEIRGLVLLAEEGINGTIAGSPQNIGGFKHILQSHAGPLTFKNSSAEKQPFRRFKVKIRQDIVRLSDELLSPHSTKNNHLSPAEWDAMLQEKDTVVIDTRNAYETAIGMFENAIDPLLKTFQEFPEYIERANIPKEKKVMLYCTGGIRCEKAILEMQRQGYEHVYQLDGGILKYLEEKPEGSFRGECFVFDHRVAVDRHLQPSQKYSLCPHCGDPADQAVNCLLCKKQAKICNGCAKKEECMSCSKNCAHHLLKKNSEAVAQ